ncbi:MAG: DUF881 domain-containing protein [Mycobacteriales bacterium]
MPTARPDAAAAPPVRRVDASMSLLVDMMTNTLDEAYAERAARRAGQRPPMPPRTSRRGRSRGAGAVLLLVGLGLLTGTAIAQVRVRQEAGTGLRADLAEEVRARTAKSDELAARTDDLRAQVTTIRVEALGTDAAGRALADRLTALGLASGTSPVEGPGIVVTVEDAPPDTAVDPLRSGTAPDGRVQDRDLQDVVNGLWAVGAEAVAVNGQRLSVLTPIRSAGDAILVDLRPLTPPYVVEAVGDPKTLELAFLDGPSGRRLMTFTSLYGIGFDVGRAESLSLPGAAAPDLRAASPASTGES